MNTTGWIVVAVVAVLLILAAVIILGRSRRNKALHGKAEQIREDVEQESVQVRRREALAEETAAKARAAQAEAEAKAAEAKRLADRADVHRSAVASSQEDLDQRRAHADSIDPRVKDTDAVAHDTVTPQQTPAPHQTDVR
jgi:predicted Holliday junction resolvase-like endonuclease